MSQASYDDFNYGYNDAGDTNKGGSYNSGYSAGSSNDSSTSFTSPSPSPSPSPAEIVSGSTASETITPKAVAGKSIEDLIKDSLMQNTDETQNGDNSLITSSNGKSANSLVIVLVLAGVAIGGYFLWSKYNG